MVMVNEVIKTQLEENQFLSVQSYLHVCVDNCIFLIYPLKLYLTVILYTYGAYVPEKE